MNRVTLRCLPVLLLLTVGGPAAAGASLYVRLGGQSAIESISATLIDRVVADPVMGRTFKGTKLPRIKQKLAEQLCELTGGPCKYSGDPMTEVHAGHNITEADFYGMVQSLRTLLRERGTGLAETNELLRLLAPMKREVVEGPATRHAP